MIHTLLADWDEERSLSREEAVELGEKIAAYVKNMLGF